MLHAEDKKKEEEAFSSVMLILTSTYVCLLSVSTVP